MEVGLGRERERGVNARGGENADGGVNAGGSVEAMIFDFGNVLIGWDPENLYRKLIPDEAERRHFLTEVCHGPWNALQDAGRSWEEAIAERIALPSGSRRAYPRLPAPLCRDADRPGRRRERDLDKIHAAGIPCYGLTNWSSETYYASRDAMPFLDRMKYTAVSGDLKMAKPEPEIFRHLLGVIGKPRRPAPSSTTTKPISPRRSGSGSRRCCSRTMGARR